VINHQARVTGEQQERDGQQRSRQGAGREGHVVTGDGRVEPRGGVGHRAAF
jgi:hypothetical protein